MSMARTLLTVAFVFAVCAAFPLSAAAEKDKTVVWDMGADGVFDGSNKQYKIDDGRVTVDFSKKPVLCPTGLGHLASGMSSVKEIRIRFIAATAGRHWLHALWNPGGSGNEQFELLCNGVVAGKSDLVDAKRAPNVRTDQRFAVELAAGGNTITLRYLSGDGLRFDQLLLSSRSSRPAPLKPTLKFPTLDAYQAAIRQPAVMFDGDYVRLFAPKEKRSEARTIFGYLVKAYDELYRLVGVHTKYKIVVYHFPTGSKYAWGGTGVCTIWYSYKSLDLDKQDEWRRHDVPHVSGYIEEMAHNFVSATRAQFGWEMIGWTIGARISKKVAGNPIHARQIRQTRRTQQKTFRRYKKGKYVFPPDIPANLCDRIHAYLLWKCENKYGDKFWKDFFRIVRNERSKLAAAKDRDGRYRVTIDCFDRLEGIAFKKRLRSYRISLKTDVKSLNPESADWNRKLGP